jgi:hypothetical protein
MRCQARELGASPAWCTLDERAHDGLAKGLVTLPVRREVAGFGEVPQRLPVFPDFQRRYGEP